MMHTPYHVAGQTANTKNGTIIHEATVSVSYCHEELENFTKRMDGKSSVQVLNPVAMLHTISRFLTKHYSFPDVNWFFATKLNPLCPVRILVKPTVSSGDVVNDIAITSTYTGKKNSSKRVSG